MTRRIPVRLARKMLLRFSDGAKVVGLARGYGYTRAQVEDALRERMRAQAKDRKR